MIADRLEVSVRTVYRDRPRPADRRRSDRWRGGRRYLLRPGFQLPPLMFTLGEIEALMVGARMVEAWAGRELSAAATEAMVKIAAVAPPERMRAAGRVAIYAPGMRFDEALRTRFDLLVRGIEERRKVSFAYRDVEGGRSERVVRPLALHFWAGRGRSPPGASCARISGPSHRPRRRAGGREERFQPEPGRTLEDYMARVTRDRPGDVSPDWGRPT